MSRRNPEVPLKILEAINRAITAGCRKSGIQEANIPKILQVVLPWISEPFKIPLQTNAGILAAESLQRPIFLIRSADDMRFHGTAIYAGTEGRFAIPYVWKKSDPVKFQGSLFLEQSRLVKPQRVIRHEVSPSETIITVDPGDKVICDVCNKDWTYEPESGGFIFSGYAYCPECARTRIESIRGYSEEKYIEARCPPGVSFADWIRSRR